MTKAGVVAILLIAMLVVTTTLWLLATRAAGPDNRAESARISYNVEYVVRDASGRIKEQGSIHNDVNDPQALDEVFRRVTGLSGGSSGDYEEIGALLADSTTDDPANGVESTSITLNLDGGGGSGNQNPADGAVSEDFATDSGSGTIVVTFTAVADNTEIKQIVLTKNSNDNTSNGTANIDDTNIFAYVDVADIILDTNDSVTYTWTINVD